MGNVRTSLALCLALPLLAGPVGAADRGDDPLLRLFATCTGRLSALREDQWHGAGALADQSAARMAMMAELTQAMTPAGAEAQVMGWRVEAKAAQAALLSTARFGQDRSTAERAAGMAEHQIAPCRSLLLGQ